MAPTYTAGSAPTPAPWVHPTRTSVHAARHRYTECSPQTQEVAPTGHWAQRQYTIVSPPMPRYVLNRPSRVLPLMTSANSVDRKGQFGETSKRLNIQRPQNSHFVDSWSILWPPVQYFLNMTQARATPSSTFECVRKWH